jgi:hypothetical protein
VLGSHPLGRVGGSDLSVWDETLSKSSRGER